MKKFYLNLFLFLFGVESFASGAQAVYDAVNHAQLKAHQTQSVLNTDRLVAINKSLKDELELIRLENQKMKAELEQVKNYNSQIDTTTKETKLAIGSPTKIVTSVDSIPQSEQIETKNFAIIKEEAKNIVKDEELYGEKADPILRFKVIEAQYQDFEKIVEENQKTKKAIINKREAYKKAIEQCQSIGEQEKLQNAIAICESQLQDLERQETDILRRLTAMDIRNRAVDEGKINDEFNFSILIQDIKNE